MTSPEPTELKFSALPRRYAGASAQERLTQRRERLLTAALDVFGRNGYAGTTMRLICANARMTERYFYECFTSVDEVFRAVHERLSNELIGQITANLSQEGDSVQLARGALRVFFDYIKADPRRARILLLDAMMLGLTNPNVADSRASWYADLIKRRLRARYRSLPDDLDVAIIASGFLGQVLHAASVWAQRGFDTPVERMVDHTVYAWIGLHQWLSASSGGATPSGGAAQGDLKPPSAAS